MKTLVVEDQERLGRFLQQGLTECSYTVSWVRTCAAALDALAESTYDVILLDLGLPDGDGLDLLKRWRKNGFKEPVLMHGRAATRETSGTGASAWLSASRAAESALSIALIVCLAPSSNRPTTSWFPIAPAAPVGIHE